MRFKLLLLSLFATSPAISFEINTHQAITTCALSNKCLGIEEQQGSQNLNYFALTMKLNDVDYESQVFEKYGDKYLNYATSGKGLGEHVKNNKKAGKFIKFTEGQTYLKGADNKTGKVTNLIDYSKTSYISLIEAGSVLEDAKFHNAANNKLGSADGRFNNHFYWAQNSHPVGKPYPPLGYRPFFWLTDEVLYTNSFRLSDKASLATNPWDAWPSNRTDAMSWALDKDVDLGNDRVNEYNLPKAFEYFKKSFGGTSFGVGVTEEERKKYQAKMFVALGHVIHLLEDLHSPAHVRNGAHAGGDYLEIFGRHNGGFVLRNGRFPSTNNYKITKAIEDIDVDKEILRNNGYSSYQSFFKREAFWVSKNFFSEAHSFIASLFEKHLYTDTDNPGVNLGVDTCGSRNTTILNTLRNSTPHSIQTNRVPATEGYNYIRSNGNNSVIKGLLSDKTDIAYEQKGSFLMPPAFRCKTMAAPILEGLRHPSYNSFDKEALLDTAKHVIPRAVASVQAFTNFFFRGRLEASLSFDNQYLIVKNVSDYGLVADPRLTTFKADEDAVFSLYHINAHGVSKLIKNDFNFEKDLKARPSDFVEPDENKTAFYIGDLLKDKGIEIEVGDTGENNRLILVFDGNIGDKDIMLADDYGIGAKGLSSTYVTKSMVKKTGATVSYDNYDDAWYKKGATNYYIREPRLIEGESGSEVLDTVLDVTTGLMWQDDAEVGAINKPWIDSDAEERDDFNDTSGDTAISYCSQLMLGGYNDWRLPSVRELSSIVTYGNYPSINQNYFTNPTVFPYSTQPEDVYYWSSVSSPVNYVGLKPVEAYVVNFGIGRIATHEKAFRGRKHSLRENYSLNIRCVRNHSASTSTLTYEDDFTVRPDRVIDAKTKLHWELHNSKEPFTLKEAIGYCQKRNVTLNEKDWRVPNINEMASITDYTKSTSAISYVFNDEHSKYVDDTIYGSYLNLDDVYFWTSTSYPSEIVEEYVVSPFGHFSHSAVLSDQNKYPFIAWENMDAGSQLFKVKEHDFRLRCVK